MGIDNIFQKGLEVVEHGLHTAGEEGLSHIPTRHCPPHIRFKHLWVISQDSGSIMIQGILVIWLLYK